MRNNRTFIGTKIKSGIAGITMLLQVCSQVVAIVAMVAISALGFYELFAAFGKFPDVYAFLKNLLHSLEILFIATIPVFIVYSFRKYINSLFPKENSKDTYSIADDTINPLVAKKAFVTSLIGITSTFLLGKFIEILSPDKANVDPMEHTNIGGDFITIIILVLVFLTILIAFFHILYSHKE